MNYVMLDGSFIRSKDHLHDILARELRFPAYYGRNLDALHDCLTDLMEDTQISVINTERADAELQQYLSRVVRVIRDSVEENGHLFLNVI